MNTTENTISPTDNRCSDGGKNSSPTFLDLADSVSFLLDATRVRLAITFSFQFYQAATLGSNMPKFLAVSSFPMDWQDVYGF